MASNNGLASKNLFMGVAAAASVGCLAVYVWNRWFQCDQQEEKITSNGDYSRFKSSIDRMGQNQSINLTGPFDHGDPSYTPIDADGDDGRTNRTLDTDWSITVNPHEEQEQQKLIQSTSNGSLPQIVTTENLMNGNGNGKNSKDQRRFKRVIFRSRVEEDSTSPRATNGNGNGEIVTVQPISKGGPIVLTNLRLADKLKGFSCEEYQMTLQGTLNRLYGSTKILTVEEAKCLSLLLQQKSTETLLKTLTTMSNLAAFTINQDFLREQGAVELLIQLLHDETLTESTQVMLVQCIGNMAVNQTNNRLLQCCVLRIIQHLLSTNSSELQRVMCVQALTNLSVEASANDASIYAPILPVLYQRLWSHTGVNIPTLRLLVNLSCTANIMPYMLATEVDTDLLQLIDNINASPDVLVRATTFLFYIVSTIDTLCLDEEEIRSKTNELQIDFDRSLFYRLFRQGNLQRFQVLIDRLKKHENEEVRQRTSRIGQHLKNIEDQTNQ